MKSVCFLIGENIYPYRVGGMEIFNYYLIKALSERISVSYMSVKPYRHKCGKYIHLNVIKPRKILLPIQVFCNIIFRHPRTLVYSYSQAHWIVWFLLTAAARIARIPYVAVIHYGKKPPTEKFAVYRRFFTSAQKVIAVSDDIKRNFDNRYGINSEVIYPLVPFSESDESKVALRQRYGIPENATVISMVGTIKEMKNPDTVIKAVASLPEENISAINPVIVYAGSGAMIESLKKLAHECGIQDRVFFLGFVEKEKICEIMKLTDIYLIASDFEGRSVSLLEAMYNGKPIVASHVDGIKDQVSESECCFFNVKDTDSLKYALIHVCKDKRYRETIAENARKRYFEGYDYERIVDRYCAIL